MTARQIAESKFSDPSAHEMFHLVTDCFEHAANLAIDSLTQDYAQPRRSDGMESHDLRPLAVQKNSAHQFWRERRVPWSVQCYFVFLVDLVARMSEPLREFAVVGENEETFALRIEPADVEKSRKFRREQIEDGIARVRIAFGRNKTGRLVQDNRQWKIDMNELAIHFHVIARGRLRTEIRARFSVDGDATSCNQLIAMTARTDTGGGKKAIQTHREVEKVSR